MTDNPQHPDPCQLCRYRTQACAYIMDGNKKEDACLDKMRWLRKTTPAPQPPQFTIDAVLRATVIETLRQAGCPHLAKQVMDDTNPNYHWCSGESNTPAPAPITFDSIANEIRLTDAGYVKCELDGSEYACDECGVLFNELYTHLDYETNECDSWVCPACAWKVLRDVAIGNDAFVRGYEKEQQVEHDAAIRKEVLDEIGLNCWSEYQMNNPRCLNCQIGERCYEKRESLRSAP